MSNVVFFDGVDDYVNITHSASVNISGPITLSARVKIPLSATNGNQFILVKDTGTYRYGIYWDKTVGLFSFYLRLTINGIKNVNAVGVNPRDGIWRNVCGTFDGRYLRIYIDGQYYSITDAGSADTITTSAVDLRLMIWTGYIAGWLSEVQIYNRALSDLEVLYNAMHPNNPVRRGLALNLTQDSIQVAQWLDLSGNNNHGTYIGGAVPVTANLLAGR